MHLIFLLAIQSYTVAEVQGDDEIMGKSGTKLILTLREDAEEYLDDFKVI
jgi:HSP90 family molecular chaperone